MEEPVKKGRTYVALVLDQSGSMFSVKRSTVSGYNEQIQVILSESTKHTETFASLITFNGLVRESFFNQPSETLKEMNESEYNPSGATAMYDAIGYAITRLIATTDINDEYNSYLIIVLTDGEENASKSWNASSLGEQISSLENTNRWTFTIIGANQDMGTLANRLKLKSNNVISYTSDEQGTAAAFTANATQMKRFFGLRGAVSQNFCMKDYFGDAKTVNEIKPS
jgi:uncharacterized protein YegL